MSKFRFTITHNSVETVVTPINTPKITKKRETENGAIFYRGELSELVFKGADYDYLKGIEDGANRELENTILVERLCSGTWTELITTAFTMNDCSFNLHKCTITVKSATSDLYRCVYQNWDNNVNILDISTIQEVRAPQFEDTPEFTYVDNGDPAPSGNDWQMMSGPAAYDVYVRLVVYTECVGGVEQSPGSEWTLEETCSNGVAKYVKPVQFADLTSDYSAFYNTSPLPLSFVLAEPVAGNFISVFVTSYVYPTIIPNGRFLSDVLLTLAQAACSSITQITSDFFQINEDVTSSDNYVTGEENLWTELVIHQISDVLYPDADDPASKGEMNLKTLLEDLYLLFRVRWRLEGTELRIEHESYFSQTSGLDISDSDGYQVYSYDKAGTVRRHEFTTPSQRNLDFVGFDIEYDETAAAGDSVENNSVKYFVTDLTFIQGYPDSQPLDAFVMFQTLNASSIYYVESVKGAITDQFVPNGAMGWANLHDAFHRHNKMLSDGTLNANSTTFSSTIPTKKQSIVTTDCCDAIDETKTITTALGDGIIESMSIDLRTGKAEIDLIHD